MTRNRRGRAFAYEPSVTEAELTASRMHESLAAASDPKAALVSSSVGCSTTQARALRTLLDEAQGRRRS